MGDRLGTPGADLVRTCVPIFITDERLGQLTSKLICGYWLGPLAKPFSMSGVPRRSSMQENKVFTATVHPDKSTIWVKISDTCSWEKNTRANNRRKIDAAVTNVAVRIFRIFVVEVLLVLASLSLVRRSF